MTVLSLSLSCVLILEIFLACWIKDLEETYVPRFSLVLILFSENPKIPAVKREQETFTVIIPQRGVNLRSREENLVAYKSPWVRVFRLAFLGF